jgi:hypothetical protein
MAAPIFSATFSAVAISAAQDAFEIVAPSAAPIWIHEIRIGQYSDFGDAAAEMLSVQVIRGFTTAGSGGAAVTPRNIMSGGAASTATVARNNTTVAQDGTSHTLISDSFNIQAGWWYYPPEDERISLSPGERLVVRITAPADAITTNGTLIYEEGRGP